MSFGDLPVDIVWKILKPCVEDWFEKNDNHQFDNSYYWYNSGIDDNCEFMNVCQYWTYVLTKYGRRAPYSSTEYKLWTFPWKRQYYIDPIYDEEGENILNMDEMYGGYIAKY